MEDARRRYLDLIRHDGADLSPELAGAFATVPREVFVPDGFHRRDGRRVLPADRDFLRTVYSNDVLVTKMKGDVPISSSSQPSLMAIMIDALEVRPGLRILEIGAGTGYNAALLATLGAVVTTIDVQADVAARARSALARAGIPGVRVEIADGYTGGPPERYDRIIVTVGVAGISPHWLDRLEPDGRIIVPVAHAGIHPVLDVRSEPLAASVVCSAGFMSAAGPLGARHPRSHPPAAVGLEGLTETSPARWRPALDPSDYRGLWYAAGTWHRRVTHASIPGREQSYLAVLDETGASGAVVLADGAIFASGASAERYTAVGIALADRWWALGRPPMDAWRVQLALAGDPDAPIWAPARWSLAPARA
ncbi:methyltransferase domain-containing protein [Actinoplanes sp. NEAU-A12]|uniref:Protein-L-isoaspartate O-methyltransferase n=1 Tax=Actinoplanes sandaracinus TaxID=3045177 RepID=A0ABT6WP34_9ACTN|nr:methyltransferase domain-containing protein [Actinoplanes sandaracinus]MDI6101505.1 methyltransferase domain-containing protein [Actinoplanes sandaracinus]